MKHTVVWAIFASALCLGSAVAAVPVLLGDDEKPVQNAVGPAALTTPPHLGREAGAASVRRSPIGAKRRACLRANPKAHARCLPMMMAPVLIEREK